MFLNKKLEIDALNKNRFLDYVAHFSSQLLYPKNNFNMSFSPPKPTLRGIHIAQKRSAS